MAICWLLGLTLSARPIQPALLGGTLRRNLDPFGQYEDAALNDALSAAGMSSLQSHTPGPEGKITLDSPISDGGENLSIGERQIIALARAIVRGGKLLILDEGEFTSRRNNMTWFSCIDSYVRYR